MLEEDCSCDKHITEQLGVAGNLCFIREVDAWNLRAMYAVVSDVLCSFPQTAG
jgi:hypothetical protein